MEFERRFRRFYQGNVGGVGASFSGSDTLGPSLGFGASDLTRLAGELGVEASLIDERMTVDQLRGVVGESAPAAREAEREREVARERAARERAEMESAQFSGCNIRAEVSFVESLRRWYEELYGAEASRTISRCVSSASVLLLLTPMFRYTEMSVFAKDRPSLLRLVQTRWPDVTQLPPPRKHETVAGFMSQLSNVSKLFRQWDLSCGGRGG